MFRQRGVASRPAQPPAADPTFPSPPVPPGAVTPPSPFTTVSTTAQLQSAAGTAARILLSPGSYTGTGPVALGSSSLYGQPGAVLGFGVTTSGGGVYGVTFQISDPTGALTSSNHAINVLSGAPTVTDCVLYSDFTVAGLVYGFSPPAQISRCVVRNVYGWGLGYLDNNNALGWSGYNPQNTGVPTMSLISDIDVDGCSSTVKLAANATAAQTTLSLASPGLNVGDATYLIAVSSVSITTGQLVTGEIMQVTGGTATAPTVVRGALGTTPAAYTTGQVLLSPGNQFGTQEVAVWVGHPVTGGVQRVKTRHAFIGLWTGNNCWNTTFTDLDLDPVWSGCGATLYQEHYTFACTFNRGWVSGRSSHCVNSEWNDGTTGNQAGRLNTYTNLRLQGGSVGIYLDQGTSGATIGPGIVFANQSFSAVTSYPDGPAGVTNQGNTVLGPNTYAMLPGAVPVSNSHTP